MVSSVKYSTTATATGGRVGRATSADGLLDVGLSRPRELGGTGGDGTNPEQLFAAGYAACFLSALDLVARRRGLRLPATATVAATIGIGPIDDEAFGITASLEVSVPDFEPEQARALVEDAHRVCPYSNATRGNLEVRIHVVA